MSAKAAAHDNSIPSPGNLGTKLGETTKFKHNGFMASGGKGYYAAQAASSSSSAAGGDPAPGWSAADSLRQLAAQRAAQWREAEGLQEDNDFAYAFMDFDHKLLGWPAITWPTIGCESEPKWKKDSWLQGPA